MKNVLIRLTNMKKVRLGRNITELRQRANLSQGQLAEKVGVTEPYLSRLEEGCVNGLESAMLEKIASALGVCKRGTLTSYEQLVNLLLDIYKDERPMLIL